MRLLDKLNTQSGTCYISGIGPTALKEYPNDGKLIAVNDYEKFNVIPDYLVLIDALQSFSTEPERFQIIKNTRVSTVVTQLDSTKLPFNNKPEIISIGLSQRRGEVSLNSNVLDSSLTSVFTAIQVAYHLGFNTIIVCGCDLGLDSKHHLARRHNEMVRHFDTLKEEMLKRKPDLQLFSLSDVNGVLKNWNQLFL